MPARLLSASGGRDPKALSLREATTVRDLVLWAEARFIGAGLSFGHGTTNAQEEAVFLVFHALSLPFDAPEEALDRPLSNEEKARAVEFLRQRIHTRKPAAYIVGEAWFAGLRFYVDERVLVPRSPIAELIEAGFAPWIREEQVHRILDIGTGSGCIAVACALAFPRAKVDAVDISSEALEVAQRNVARYHLEDRVCLLYSDVFEAVKGCHYDLIVSNPPYVPARYMATLPPEHRHEPAIGLMGGVDGLDIVRRILLQAAEYLTDHGIVVVEVGESQDELVKRYPRLPFIWLEFERGGDGVFLLEASELRKMGFGLRETSNLLYLP